MQNLVGKFDALAGIETENKFARFLERIAFAFLILTFISAPHSIAATQTAWIVGMFAWFVRLFVKPRPKLVRTPLDIPLWALFGWSVVSAIFSYAPDISIDKLRVVALFLIFYFVINNLRTTRAAIFLAFALIFSCIVNVVWTPIERAIGRGVEIHGISENSPLKKVGLTEGDTLLKADAGKISTPEDIIKEFDTKQSVKITFYRPDFEFTVEPKKADLLNGNTAAEKLGFASWKKSRNWRSSGFYGHYATYAEVLQLIASLVFGLFIVFLTQRRKDAKTQSFLLSHLKIVLFICLCGMSLALLLTVTRASQLAFMISAFAIVLLGGNRKIILVLSAIALPLIVGGLIFLQQSRNVGFFDSKDDSTTWRETVWREGFNLWTENPRHFIVGVGMDSQKRFAKQWHLFDDGRLPAGHFHNTPLQLVVERGFPALLLWLWILFVYAKMLICGIQNSKFKIQNSEKDSALSTHHSPLAAGVLLGCFGGMIGFFTSGIVHYNLGDSEVAMVFFLLMGLSVKLVEQNKEFMIFSKNKEVNI